MQRLGRVLHISKNLNTIVKVKNVPKIGAKVVDENLKTVGKILDVFGPVSSPYASVRPRIHKSKKSTAKTLYVLPSKRKKEKI